LFGCILFMDKLTSVQWFGAFLVISGAILITKARGQHDTR
jgi:drug/metabolite transporter (DMT)-like permease